MIVFIVLFLSMYDVHILEAACRPIAPELLKNIKILDISFVKSKAFKEGLDIHGTLQNTNSISIKYLRIDLHPAYSDEIKLFYGHDQAVDIKDVNGVDIFPEIQAGETFFFEGHIIPYFRTGVNHMGDRVETRQVIITLGALSCAAREDSEALAYVVMIPTKAMTLAVQKKLVQMKYEVGIIDGVWGGKTKTAIKQFQQDQNLEITGILDESTMKALGL